MTVALDLVECGRGVWLRWRNGELSAAFILACNSCTRPEQIVRSSLVNARVHTCDTKLC